MIQLYLITFNINLLGSLLKSRSLLHVIEVLPKLFSERIYFRLRSKKTLLNFLAELLQFKSLFFFHPQSLAGILWTYKSEILYLFLLLKLKHCQFSYRRVIIGYGSSSLRDYLTSPICECGFDSESVKHFSLYCPGYAAQHDVRLASAANIIGKTCHRATMQKKKTFTIKVVVSVNNDVNCAFFHYVQSFIIGTNHFSMAIF